MAAQVPPPSSAPLTIGMLLYPGFTLLDLAGPQSALGMHGQTFLFWKTLEPVPTGAIVDFLAEAGRTARYVTSVCSGSLLLGMAGLLDGYRAATHWAVYDVLEALGVEAGRERVVVDRNRFTGGGVTAGIDFGLTLLAELRGEEVAKVTQLAMEYDPKPPFNTGHPDVAGPALTAAARAVMGEESIRQGVEIARGRRVAEPA